MNVRLAVAFAAWAVSTALCASAFAQTDPVAAEALFREARDAVKRGDHAAACPKFAESHRLDPAPGTLFNLADCEERVGKIASAWQHYKRVHGELPKSDDRAVAAAERAAKLEKRLPRLTVRLSKAPSGTTVLRDGVELGAPSLGLAIPTDPGTHTVVVRLPSGKESVTRVKLAEGQSETLDVAPPAAGDDAGDGHRPTAPASASTAAPPAATGARGATNTPTAGYVAVGVGGAALVVGAVTGLMVFSKKSTFADECDANKVCSQKGLDAADAGRRLGTISTISFAVGLAGVGVGAYLLSRDGSGAQTSLSPRLSPTSAVLTFDKTF